jgi:hypothetical protein
MSPATSVPVLNDLAISDANEIHDADDDGAAGRGCRRSRRGA